MSSRLWAYHLDQMKRLRPFWQNPSHLTLTLTHESLEMPRFKSEMHKQIQTPLPFAPKSTILPLNHYSRMKFLISNQLKTSQKTNLNHKQFRTHSILSRHLTLAHIIKAKKCQELKLKSTITFQPIF